MRQAAGSWSLGGLALKKFCILRIFGPARAARQSAQKRSAPLRLASWEQLGSF
jgi:hypothetical protein